MTIRNFVPLVFLCLGPFFGAPVFGQTQTGVINGVVEANDEALPGVTVTLRSTSIMGIKTSTSGASGIFRFPALRPGGYVIELSRDGFRGKRYEGVVVQIGQTTTLRVDLEKLAPATEELTVIAVRPIVNVTSAATSTIFDTDLLENLPLPNRGWEDVVLLAPGMVDGSFKGFGRMFSSRGGAVVDNQSAFDGVVNTFPFFNSEGAGIVFESIDEVQILTGALPAEVGNVAGSYINITTKSGSNTFGGEAAIYFQDQDLQSDNVDSGLASAGIEPTKLTDYGDWSLNLGGPIAKDKLWFNIAAGARDTSLDVTGFPEDETVENDYAFAKFTWQPTPQHSFVAMYNRHDIFISHFASQPLSTFSPEATNRVETTNEIVKLKWTGFLSDNAILEVDIGINDQDRANLAQPGASHAYFDLVTFESTGGPFQESTVTQKRDQARASLSLFREGWGESHELKFGVEYEDSRTDTFSFKEFSPVSLHFVAGGFPALVLFSNNLNGVSTPAAFEGLHAYAQDTWQVTERVALNLGLRYNTWSGSYPPQSNPGFSYGPNVSFPEILINEQIDALDWHSIEPRLAGTFVLDDEGRSAVRFGLSRYHHGINLNFFFSGNPNGIAVSTHPWVDLDGDLFADPNEVLPAVSVTSGAGTRVDPNLEQPYTDEITLGFETQLFDNFSLEVNGFYRKSNNLVEDVNISADAGSYLPVDVPDAGPDTNLGTADDGTLTVFNQIANFENLLQVSNPDNAEREMKGVELVVTKRLSNNWNGMASLIWQTSDGTVGTDFVNAIGGSPAFNDPNSLLNLNGPLPLDRKWHAKVFGTYRGPHGFTFTGYYQYLSGEPIYRSYNVLLNQGVEGVVADPKGTHRGDSFSQLDLRVEKTFPFGTDGSSLGLTLDIINVFNENNVIRHQSLGGTYIVSSGSYAPPPGAFGSPQEIQRPRILRIGARLRF